MKRFLSCLGLLALAGAASAGDIIVELRPEVLLSQLSITLADVAQVSADTPALQQAFGAVALGRAPLAGYVEQRSRAELDLALRGQALSQGQTITWRGATSVKLRSQSQQLDSALLLELARRQVLQMPGADAAQLTVSLAAPLPDLAAPAGALQYQARLVDASRLRTHMAVWIDIIAHDAVYRSVVVPLAVSARRGVYVARRMLPAGSIANASDFTERQDEIANLTDAALVPGALVHGGRVRQALAAGQIVTVRQMTPDDMLLRGDRVRLVMAAAGIEVETGAYAQADAVVGQLVRVRPERSTDMVTARVMAPGLVRIDGR